VPHTHWDREWYEPFEVFRAHLAETLDDAFDQLERDPRLRFTLDGHVALVDDYLVLRPQAEQRIRSLVQGGQLHIGPFYTQADTLLADGESLIRNLAAGIRRGDTLGGAMRIGYMPDQFGHAAQLPQLLRLFGIESAVLWRGVGPERPPHAFRWVAPDGSWVTALWLQDGYGSGRRLPSDPEGFADGVERMLSRLEGWIGEVPLLVPVGDDHARLASWLPAAAAALRARLPSVLVEIGGYHDHFPHLGPVPHELRGELRSPAFAPVLAGVAAVRVREKQAGAHATTLLCRYAEPLTAWLSRAAPEAAAPIAMLLDRAWQQLFLNHAHDSAAGCGVDAAHEDVKARYRWAEQLARAACDQALAGLRIAAPEGAQAFGIGFHPGPAADTALLEVQVPRSLADPLVAVSSDGIARPVQSLGDEQNERALFEGEFAASEIGQYLGGLDPLTPIFGRYLTGIVLRDEGAGVYQLDVGLGDAPATPAALAEDQRRIASLTTGAARFKVILHAATPTRTVLAQAGAVPQAGFFSVSVQPGRTSSDGGPRASALADGIGITNGPISVVAEQDGSVLIRDARLTLGPVWANLLVDEGDRGDLYHFDPAGAKVVPHAAQVEVTERGPLRARLRIVHDLELPVGLDEQRRGRAAATRLARVITEITLSVGSSRIELVTSFENEVYDHRLRALVRIPLRTQQVHVQHGLAVVARALDWGAALGHGTEQATPTGQQHGFVDVTDGRHGVALMSRGLPEYELQEEAEEALLALTLLRGVGWLSRGDLSVITHAAGPIVPTPGAEELGPHRFEYAIELHHGDWAQGGVAADAERYAAPPMAVRPSGAANVPDGIALVEIEPRWVSLSAAYPSRDRGVVVRVLNASERPVTATLRLAGGASEAIAIDPLELPITTSADHALYLRDGVVHLPLRAWEISTVLVR